MTENGQSIIFLDLQLKKQEPLALLQNCSTMNFRFIQDTKKAVNIVIQTAFGFLKTIH